MIALLLMLVLSLLTAVLSFKTVFKSTSISANYIIIITYEILILQCTSTRSASSSRIVLARDDAIA